jgi:hypothetical protein
VAPLWCVEHGNNNKNAQGVDAMNVMFMVILVVALICSVVFIGEQRKKYRIRKTGLRVMAKVICVSAWQESTTKDYSLQTRWLPIFNDGWRYEISAEWIDPKNGDNYVFTSGRKKGLPSSKQGDYLPAYISPFGNYLECA